MARRGGKRQLEKEAYNIIQSVNCIQDVDRVEKGLESDKREELFEQFKHMIVDSKGNNLNVSYSELEGNGKYDFKKIQLSDGTRLNEKGIYSINTLKNTLTQTKAIGKFMRETFFQGQRFHYGYIKPEQYTAFLDFKKEEGSSVNTLKAYKMTIQKILSGLEVKGWLNQEYDYKQVKEYDSGQKEDSYRILTNNQVERVVNYAFDNRQEIVGRNGVDYGAALKLQSILGLRVQELINLKAEHITIGQGEQYNSRKFGSYDTSNTVFIDKSKGGLSRHYSLNDLKPEDRKFIESLKNDTRSNGYLFKGLTRNSYCKFFGRITESVLGTTTMKTHEIRKYWSSSQYEQHRDRLEGEYHRALTPDEKYEIKARICSQLGHGVDNRRDLQKIYIDSAF